MVGFYGLYKLGKEAWEHMEFSFKPSGSKHWPVGQIQHLPEPSHAQTAYFAPLGMLAKTSAWAPRVTCSQPCLYRMPAVSLAGAADPGFSKPQGPLGTVVGVFTGIPGGIEGADHIRNALPQVGDHSLKPKRGLDWVYVWVLWEYCQAKAAPAVFPLPICILHSCSGILN